jgi:hypothetical protein
MFGKSDNMELVALMGTSIPNTLSIAEQELSKCVNCALSINYSVFKKAAVRQ